MLDRALHHANRWVLDHVEPQWVDYVVSNTMTDLNRRINDFLWTYELKAHIEQVIDEAPGVKTFVLRPNQHWRGFQAGQHVELCLDIDGQSVRRHYSVSGRPRGRFSITVKRQEGGLASTWMHAHLRAGMSLTLTQPQGQFVYRDQSKALFLCAGSGITPCHSMVTALLARPDGDRPDLQVIAQFRDEAHVIFKQDLQAWARAGVKVTTAMSRGPVGVSAAHDKAPRIDADQLARLCPDLRDREVYLCGPEGFMTQMIELLRGLGVDLARVHTERFSFSDATAPTADTFEAAGAEIYFKNFNARITLDAEDQGKTLLQIGRDHGLPMESGCCQGMCGTCKLTLHDGQVSGNVLGQAVYLCTAYPASRSVVLGG